MSFGVATNTNAQDAYGEFGWEYGPPPGKYRNFERYGYWVGRVQDAEDELENLQKAYHTTGVKPDSEGTEKVCENRLAILNMIMDGTDHIHTYNVVVGLIDV